MPMATEFRGIRTVGAALAAAVVMTAGACEKAERLNAPPQGWSERQAALQESYVYMSDNAMLSERHVSDVHFVPHTAALNSLGARRLDRFATLLKAYGGSLHYDTGIQNADLIKARLESVRTYLAAAGVDMDTVTVSTGPVMVAGMGAREAMQARATVTAGQGEEDSGGGGGSSDLMQSILGGGK
jgi:outer membrane protein OmpA-like peptidoglycan-associated protein